MGVVVSHLVEILPGAGRTILIIVPHADDATLQCGGSMILWAAAGWKLVLLRVTNDATDSDGLDRATTIERNRNELDGAAAVLGVSVVIDLDYETDTLADCSERDLREHLIRAIRQYRPYAMVTFDPFSGPGENNQDHLRVAQAADEAFWTAMFDKHHPEHLSDGLAPHGVFERWYFAKRLIEVSAAVDVSTVIEWKVAPVAEHRTMMGNMIHQAALQADCGGVEGAIRALLRPDDPGPFVDRMVRHRASVVGVRHRVAYAEEYRRVIFSDFGTILG